MPNHSFILRAFRYDRRASCNGRQPKPHWGRDERGFNLLELMVVIAIVLILVALSVPLLGSVRASSKAGRCVNNLKRLGEGVTTYTAENNGTLPPFRTTDTERNWYLFLMYGDAYYASTLRLQGVLPNTNPGNAEHLLTVYNCPSNPGRIGRWYYPNYAYNRALGESRLANIESPGRVLLLADAGYRVDSDQARSIGPDRIVCYITEYGGSTYYWERSLDFDGHSQRTHIVFVDGHVESLTRKEVEVRGKDGTLLWSRGNAAVNDAKRTNYW